jgi:nitrite reductase/ring-hydroxylating ferredoxin subunit
VFKEQIGVNRAANVELPDAFTRVARFDELVESQPHAAKFKDTPIVIVRRGSGAFALLARCAHAGGPLAEGTVEGNTITCPWHGSTYDIATGSVVTGPSAHEQPCLQSRVVDGWVEVRFDPARDM